MRIVIAYDADAKTAEVTINGKVQNWTDAHLTLAQGITETRDGYLIRRERDGSKSCLRASYRRSDMTFLLALRSKLTGYAVALSAALAVLVSAYLKGRSDSKQPRPRATHNRQPKHGR